MSGYFNQFKLSEPTELVCAICKKKWVAKRWRATVCTPCSLKWDIANCELIGHRMRLANELAGILHVTAQEAVKISYRAFPYLLAAKMDKGTREIVGEPQRDDVLDELDIDIES